MLETSVGKGMTQARSKLCALGLSALLAGCAATLPGEPVGTGPSPDDGDAPPPAPRPAAPKSNALTRDVGGPDGVIRLCDALRDEDGILFEGNEVARARAREDHERDRMQAADLMYVVQVPANGFAFRAYDLADRRLVIDSSRSFMVADGVEIVSNDAESPLSFELSPEHADAALKQHAQARTTLKLVFRPARSQLRRDVCVRNGGGHLVRLPADVLSYTLVGTDGHLLARGQATAFADEATSANAVTTPEVRINRPRTGEGRDVSETIASAARTLGPALLPCYRKALESRPNERGTLVIEMNVRTDGVVESSRMQMSSLGDQALVACSLAKTTHARLPGVTGPAHLSLPITFGAKEDK